MKATAQVAFHQITAPRPDPINNTKIISAGETEAE